MGLERSNLENDALRVGCKHLAKDALRTTAASAHWCASRSGFLFPKRTGKSGLDGREGEEPSTCWWRGTLRGPCDAQWESASPAAPALGGRRAFSLHKLGLPTALWGSSCWPCSAWITQILQIRGVIRFTWSRVNSGWHTHSSYTCKYLLPFPVGLAIRSLLVGLLKKKEKKENSPPFLTPTFSSLHGTDILHPLKQTYEGKKLKLKSWNQPCK